MVRSCQSMSSKGLPAHVPFVWHRHSMKAHSVVCSVLVVVRVLCHELRRLVIRQFPHELTPIKKEPLSATQKRRNEKQPRKAALVKKNWTQKFQK